MEETKGQRLEELHSQGRTMMIEEALGHLVNIKYTADAINQVEDFDADEPEIFYRALACQIKEYAERAYELLHELKLEVWRKGKIELAEEKVILHD